jgi:hypothetical protein
MSSTSFASIGATGGITGRRIRRSSAYHHCSGLERDRSEFTFE